MYPSMQKCGLITGKHSFLFLELPCAIFTFTHSHLWQGWWSSQPHTSVRRRTSGGQRQTAWTWTDTTAAKWYLGSGWWWMVLWAWWFLHKNHEASDAGSWPTHRTGSRKGNSLTFLHSYHWKHLQTLLHHAASIREHPLCGEFESWILTQRLVLSCVQVTKSSWGAFTSWSLQEARCNAWGKTLAAEFNASQRMARSRLKQDLDVLWLQLYMQPRLVCPGEGAAPMQDDLVLQKEEMDTSEYLDWSTQWHRWEASTKPPFHKELQTAWQTHCGGLAWAAQVGQFRFMEKPSRLRRTSCSPDDPWHKYGISRVSHMIKDNSGKETCITLRGLICRVRWSLVTLPTLWSLVTLPTSLGRVASDYFVVFSWPCSHENKARQISFFVVACDPTYLWGRVASDYFLALPTHPLVAWPYLRSDRLWPYRQFVTLAMGFAWQVQQFRCLWDVVPWPYTCLLGRVASDRHWLCVAGATFSTPPRCCPLTVYWRVRKSRKWQTLTLCGRCHIFDASEKFSVTLLPCVAGAIFSCPPWSSSWSHVLFVWQVQYFRCLREVLCDPTSLCGRCNISCPPWSSSWSHVLFVWQVQYFRCLREVPAWPGPMIACDPTSFLRGRCNLFDACDPTYLWGRVASDYFQALPTHPLVAWPYLRSDRLWPYRQFVTLAMGFAWQVQQFRCLWDVVPWPYTCLLGRVASDRHWLCVAGSFKPSPTPVPTLNPSPTPV